tara:strand:+ start:621 stop:1388 length:768 start_codon:yes stop_codon:yes gene_type:complete
MNQQLLQINAYNLRSRDVENRALRGWKKIGIATIVIIFVILICVQYAFKVPVWDSMSSDKATLAKYSKSQIMLSKLILGAVAISLAAGIYIIFESCQWSFECLLQGGKQGQRRIRNSGLQNSKRMSNITDLQLQLEKGNAEQALYNQQNQEQNIAFDVAMQKQQQLEQQKIQNLQEATTNSSNFSQMLGIQQGAQPGIGGSSQGMSSMASPGSGFGLPGMQTPQMNNANIVGQLLHQASVPGSQQSPTFSSITRG